MPNTTARLNRRSLSASLKKIAVLRRDVEQELAGAVSGVLQRIGESAAAAVLAGRSGAAVSEVPLALVAELRVKALEATRSWPQRSWDQLRAGLRPEHGIEANRRLLDELLDEACWPLDGPPFTLRVLDQVRIADALRRNAERRMQSHMDVWMTISRQLDIQLGLDGVTVRNAAARARQEAGFLVDAFIEVGMHSDSEATSPSGPLPEKKTLTHRESSAHGGRGRAQKTPYPEIRVEIERRLNIRGDRQWRYGDIAAFVDQAMKDFPAIKRPETIRRWIKAWRERPEET